MRWIACFLLLLLGLGTPPALAEKRVALVIGNDAYVNMPTLRKAVADARAVRDTLAALGFDVVYDENVPLGKTKQMFFDFSGKLAQGDIAFVFYAGHGVALGGANYLLPSDTPAVRKPESEGAIKEEEERLAEFAISEAFVIQRIKAKGARVGIVVLDACRDNPLRVAEPANPFRSTRPGDLVFGASRGLARVQAMPEGIFSVYSANFGQGALDRLGQNDTDPNSPFTRIFLKHLATPGKGLRTVMVETREEVVRLARAIGVEQRPALYDEVVGGDLFLNGEPSGDGKAPETPAADPIAADYALAAAVGTKEAWEAFLKRHGERADSFHVQLAEAALKKLAVGIFPIEPAQPPKKPELPPEPRKAYKPGDTFRDCPECPEMVVVPAGSFTMGSPKSEKERADNEGPQREVAIAVPFAVGKFEVTRGEFGAFVQATGQNTGSKCWTYEGGEWKERSGRTWRKLGFEQTDEHPVACVNWNDAQAYVTWLSDTTGENYRLLSEAEWEYAARAGTATPFSTGKTITTDQANFNGDYTYNGSGEGKYRQKTVEVGSFPANAFGLHDMHGNMWEWVEDCWNESYKGAPLDGSARTTGECGYRGQRGGSWFNLPWFLRSAIRSRNEADYRVDYIGLRVARTLTP